MKRSKSEAPHAGRTNINRRRFLYATGVGLGAASLLPACEDDKPTQAPNHPSAGPTAGEGPEVKDLRLGIIALTDCSPIVIAHEKGFFKKYGLKTTVVKGASWAAIRDALSTGDLHATHMLLGMPIASSMGLLGSPKKPMVIPWILNRNGQAITLKSDLKGKVGADPKALKPLVDAAKARGEPMAFAMTFPTGTHAMWLRYYLAAGGIDPDKDVSLITVPPPQMITNMKLGKMNGFCVGRAMERPCH